MNATPTVSSPVISLGGVGKCFGPRKVANDISFDVAGGEVVCLLGASGSGKSTILRMIAGIERADEGTIRLGGSEVDGALYVPPEQRRVGLVFQDLALFPHLDATGNAGFGLFRSPRREAQARVTELLALVGLSAHARAFPHQLSGGEQQRLAVARALAPRPQAMLLDEPFSGLDDRLRDQVRKEVMALLRAEGTATVFVTHDPDEALRSADRIVLLRDGRIVQQGAPGELLSKPADLGAAAFFSPVNQCAGTVAGGVVATAFGAVPAAGLADGTAVTVAFRPRDLSPSGEGPALRVAAADLTADGLYVTAMPEEGDLLTAVLAPGAGVRAGDVIHLRAKPARGFVFPA